MKKTELAIGDSTELIVSYASGISPGRANKYANISYKDTTSAVMRLELHAQVVPQLDTIFKVQLSSPSLDFSVTKGEKPEEKKLYLKNTDVAEYKVSLVDYPKEFFKVKLDKKLKPGKSIEIKVKPLKNLLEEGLKRSLTLELKGEEKTRITVPIVFNILTTPVTPQK